MSLILKGRVVSGDKSGAYFMSQYHSKIKAKTGTDMFPGTLNVECLTTPRLPSRSHFISSWTEAGKQYGAAWVYPAVMLNTKAFVVVPELSHHNVNTIEIISQHCLRTKLNLKNGDYVEVEVDEAR